MVTEIMKFYYGLLWYITKKNKLERLSHFGFVPVMHNHMKSYIGFV